MIYLNVFTTKKYDHDYNRLIFYSKNIGEIPKITYLN